METALSERRQGSEWTEQLLREVRDWEGAYAESLNTLAARAGQTPEEFEREMFARLDAAKVTHACFTLAEIEHWLLVPDDRRRHAEGCRFCGRLLETMRADSTER